MSRTPYRIQRLADRDLDDHVQCLRERHPEAALRYIGSHPHESPKDAPIRAPMAGPTGLEPE